MNIKFFLYKCIRTMISALAIMVLWMLLELYFYGKVENNVVDNIIAVFIMILFYKYYSLKENTLIKDEIIILSSKTARNIERASVKFNDNFYEIIVFHASHDFSKIEDIRFAGKMPSLQDKEKMMRALERRYRNE